MRWELRARARERGLGTAAAMRLRLAAEGVRVSEGKMWRLWSTTPVTIRLEELEVMCAVLACRPSDLLIPDRPPTSTAVSSLAPPAMADRAGADSPPGSSKTARRRAPHGARVAGRGWGGDRPVPPL